MDEKDITLQTSAAYLYDGGWRKEDKAQLITEYPEKDIYHHESDLYVYATPLTWKVIERWFAQAGLSTYRFVTSFKDQITGRRMYDVTFQYTPYWQSKAKREG